MRQHSKMTIETVLPQEPPQNTKPIYKKLYFQVIVGIIIGLFLGVVSPELAEKMKPFSDGFIKLIKMMIGPIIFTTVVVGIGKMGDMKEVGRVGLKSVLYFEIVSTAALLFGLVMINIWQPGAGLNINPSSLSNDSLAQFSSKFEHGHTTIDFLMNLIPHSIISAFAEDNILQILLFSILFGLSLSNFGSKGKVLVRILDQTSHTLFGIVNIIMKLAPMGAFGAIAFTVGKYGFASLAQLGNLVLAVYVTCFLFVVIVLGGIARALNVNIWRFISYIKEEILLVLATSSSESALPRMMVKLENIGCAKPVVGMVIPTGYSFNLDGTSIYLTMAAIFLAQALNIDLTLQQQIGIVLVLFFTSKGAAAVTGGGFIVLVSTLQSVESIPVASAAILLGVDRFMSEARAITNLIGNGIATIAISKWEKAFDSDKAKRVLQKQADIEADEPERVSDIEMKDYWL